MKNTKIIFFDIDGTLIAMDQDTISEKTLEALKRLQEKGVKLCLATGRGPMLIPHFEGVEFDEPVENPPLPFGRNAAARVGDVETEPAALRPVAEADRPFGGEFRGVGQQVDQQLRKPVAVGVEQTCVKPRFEDQFDAFGRFHADDVLLFVHQFVQLEVREVEFQSSGLDLREVEDVADQLQEQGVVVLDDRNVFPLFLLLVGLGKDAREPSEGDERCLEIVAQKGQE